MGLPMFSTPASPIAIDFGASSVKILQIGEGERPRLLGAAEIEVPDAIRADQGQVLAFYSQHLPGMLSRGFRGRRAVLAIPSAQTFIQHMQIGKADKARKDDLIKGQLFSQIGCTPDSVVVRSVEVTETYRSGQAETEIICFAITRDTIMRFVDLLKQCRLNVVGVHSEALAIVGAFDHLNRRATDTESTTMYIDLGWNGTHVAIAHGTHMRFARHIPVGGRHFDQHIAEAHHCDLATARSHRLALAATATPSRRSAAPEQSEIGAALLEVAASAHAPAQPRGSGSAIAEDQRTGHRPDPTTCHELPPVEFPLRTGKVDFNELVDTISDELSMCLRYHQGLFPERPVDRCIFVGGEARQVWLCQHVVKGLHLPAQLGDPLMRTNRNKRLKTPGVNFDEPQPGWSVAYGLCSAPTDL